VVGKSTDWNLALKIDKLRENPPFAIKTAKYGLFPNKESWNEFQRVF